ncbi:MAG: carboxypeptidase regulatory-like domain-containing protein [Acidobacteria bacterium]|nr:carboxypeptidase regulatory-like domain-containing protein [Acidobacteriota bacterium]
MQQRNLWMFASIFALAMAVACGGGGGGGGETAAPAATPAAPAAAPVDSASAGNIAGTVMIEGTPPGAEELRMSSDPVCVQQATNTSSEHFVVGEGNHLGNVFVYVKEGLEGRSFPEPSGVVTLDQVGCRYSPHVFGLRVGQTLAITNSDPTLHNIHATPTANAEFNMGQPIQGMKSEQTFESPEVMVPFKCDVHGWMHAYVGVLDHPYFATTAQDGLFEISTLPPGDYVLEAWHEKLGTQTQNVTVVAGATADVAFTFSVL